MNNIQIFQLALKNYRQYKDVEEIDLEIPADKHINIIEGQNGAGKSNLLNAITLCFYGEEPHIDEEELGADPLANKKILEKLDVGESTRGHVEVTLGKDKPQYVFTRKFRTAKVGEDDYNSVTEDLQLRQRFGPDWQNVENPNTRLREILPTHVYKYFLFDGEQLDDFFDPGYTDRVQSAVLDISHIQLLERALNHLDTVRKTIEDEASEVEGEPQEFHEEYKEAEALLEDYRDEKDQLESDIDDANKEIERIDEELADSTNDEVREKQQRRRYLNERLADREEELQNARGDAAVSLARAGPVAYNKDALEFTLEEIHEWETQRGDPPDIPEWWLEQLLEQGRCICGTDIDSEEEKREHLKDFKQRVSQTTTQGIEGKRKVERALDQGDDLIGDLRERKRRVEDIREDIEAINAELEEISAALESKDIPNDVDVAELEKQRKRIDGRVKDMREDLGQLRGKIEQQKAETTERRNKWQRELENESKHDELLRKIQFVEKAHEKVRTIEREILEKVRAQTENALETNYNDLIWKDEEYDIELTEDYEVHVYKDGMEKHLGSLSAGESQVLALSFMSALSNISGFRAPVVIDTPLGRISSKPKKRIAQNVPNYLRDSQVTFLMTDEEYTNEVEAFLQDAVANQYHLQYDDDVTEVVRE